MPARATLIELTSAGASVQAAADGAFRLQLTIANEGFATPLTQRPVEIVLRHTATGATSFRRARRRSPPIVGRGDARTRLPCGCRPISRPASTILVNLPDASATLRGQPRYSIQLANVRTWEASAGFNDLGLRFRIR